MKRYIYAKKVFMPAGVIDTPCYLEITDGKFGEIRECKPEGADIIDYSDYAIAPGLVDTHIHGYNGYDVMDGSEAALHEISKGLLETGVTTFLATTLTAKREVLTDVCRIVGQVAGKEEGAQIAGIFLEGPFFSEAHKGAQNPAYMGDPEIEALREWQEASGGLVKKIALAPERPGSLKFIRQARALGVISSIAHTDATYDHCRDAVNAGAKIFIHTYNGMRGLHHREPGVVGAALTLPHVFAEMICDGYHVHPVAAEIVTKMRGSEQTVLITDCMRGGGLGDGESKLGEFDVVIKEGAARLADSGSLAGSVLSLIKAVQNVVEWGLATPEEALRMASMVPADSVEMADRCGQIIPDRQADFIVLDDKLNLQATYIKGECRYQKGDE